jgi:F-box-like
MPAVLRYDSHKYKYLTNSHITRFFREKDRRCSSFPQLPSEIVHKILSYLSLEDIWNARVINRRFYHVSCGFVNEVFARSGHLVQIEDNRGVQVRLFPDERRNSPSYLLTWSGVQVYAGRALGPGNPLVGTEKTIYVTPQIEGRSLYPISYYRIMSRFEYDIVRLLTRIRDLKLGYVHIDDKSPPLGRSRWLSVMVRLRFRKNGNPELSMRTGYFVHLIESFNHSAENGQIKFPWELV